MVKVSKDSRATRIYGMAMDKINNVLYGSLPTGKYREYEFCFSGACGSMKSITGTEFNSNNFQSVAIRAKQH